jgi:hypothetical protein
MYVHQIAPQVIAHRAVEEVSLALGVWTQSLTNS